jgi:hypothetical protein
VVVFAASSIMHMLLPYHRSDFRKLPAEDEVMSALGKFGIPPGDYVVPCAGSPQHMKDPVFIEKMQKGPVAFLTVMESGPPRMGKSLGLWFVYCLVVGLFAGYVASRAVPAGGDYLAVFRFVGSTAFAAYAIALWQNTIWFKRAMGTTLKSTLDGLVYALLTAGTFGWLWPA